METLRACVSPALGVRFVAKVDMQSNKSHLLIIAVVGSCVSSGNDCARMMDGRYVLRSSSKLFELSQVKS